MFGEKRELCKDGGGGGWANEKEANSAGFKKKGISNRWGNRENCRRGRKTDREKNGQDHLTFPHMSLD